jgi:ElaB/YqjD/DUF883 family membrane-anchored ribosome-binding protein
MSPTDAHAPISQLGDYVSQAAESQRQLFQEMTSFARDETSRFANLRLERNGQVLEKMQTCQGLPGLIGVQQEWLRTFFEDYLGQQMRFASAFRGLAQEVVTTANETASETIDRMQRDGQEIVDTAGQQLNQMAQDAGNQMDQTAQNTGSYLQGTQH